MQVGPVSLIRTENDNHLNEHFLPSHLSPPTQVETQNTLHEYELSQSHSLTFLYNLLYDPQSLLSKTEILTILNSFEHREKNLPFSFKDLKDSTTIQGLLLPAGLKQKFCLERFRVGLPAWFRNIPGSRHAALTVSTEKLVFNGVSTNFHYRA